MFITSMDSVISGTKFFIFMHFFGQINQTTVRIEKIQYTQVMKKKKVKE